MTDNYRPRVLCNDDGWIIGAGDAPLTPEQMQQRMIAPYADTPIDTFLWSVGGHEVYDYETEIGELFGQGYDLKDENQRRKVANLHYLIEHHTGPVTTIATLCHQAGLRFFPSVRMNEHYDMDEAAPNYGRLRRDHPDWLIGRPDEDLHPSSLEWGIRTGINYAVADVRRHMGRIIGELIDRFDIDGIELDFMRHPAFFRREEAYAHAHLLTDLIQQVRQQLNKATTQRGRQLELAIRVPPSLDHNRRIGLDTQTWIKEGLVDLLIAGGGFIPFEMEMVPFVEAAAGTSTKVLGCFEALRPLLSDELLYAVAARYWDAGVDGLYLFNYYSMSNQWRRQVLGRMVDPSQLQKAPKRYEFDQFNRSLPTSQLGWSFHNAVPPVQTPVTLHQPLHGRPVTLCLDIADDLAQAQADYTLASCQLALFFQDLGAAQIELHFNGTPIPWGQGRKPATPWTHSVYDPEWNQYPSKMTQVREAGEPIEFDLSSLPLKKGPNQIKIRPLDTDGTPVLLGASIKIAYK